MKVYLVWKREPFSDEILKAFVSEKKAKEWLMKYAEKWNLTRLDDFYQYEYIEGDCSYFIVEQEVEE